MSNTTEVVLVTGGSRGIGKAIAAALQVQGMRVVITGRDQERLELTAAALGPNVLAITADAADEEHTKRVVARVFEEFGRIDVLVNNAGTAGPGGPLISTPPAQWWGVQATNVRGPMLYMHSVVPHMIRAGSGKVINIGSYAGFKATPGNAAYAASKAALASMTHSVAAELAEFCIDVFCVSPGLVDTDMTRDVPVFQNLPADSWSSVERIGQLVGRLITEDFSKLSGCFLHVRDDLDALLSRSEEIDAGGLYQLGLSTLAGRVL